jgi:RNA polymerase sigma-70 factor (ECF subfamily)
VISAFAAACRAGDLERLVALLDPGVVWRGDGGGQVAASHRVERGARNVARRPPRGGRMAVVNGAPGLVLTDADGVLTVVASPWTQAGWSPSTRCVTRTSSAPCRSCKDLLRRC